MQCETLKWLLEQGKKGVDFRGRIGKICIKCLVQLILLYQYSSSDFAHCMKVVISLADLRELRRSSTEFIALLCSFSLSLKLFQNTMSKKIHPILYDSKIESRMVGARG